MGFLYNFYWALTGFFAFSAVYHLILWSSSSQRKPLLIVFSVDCGLLAALCGFLSTLITAQTPETAEHALWARLSIGPLILITWLWSMSLVSGVRARWFVWPTTAMFFAIFIIHTFAFPLNARVISLTPIATPWSEIVSIPQLGPVGWWFKLIFVVVLATYLYGLICAIQIWRRDRIIGTLILVASIGLVLNNVVLETLRNRNSLHYPIYLGVIVQLIWVCVVAMLIARDNQRVEDDLAVGEKRLQLLSRQLITLQETERSHLARELHDEIGQVLTAMKMNLRRTQRSPDAEVKSLLDENVAMIEQAIVQVRNLALSLRPAQLDELGLVAALHWLLKQQAELGGFEDQLEVNLGGVEIPAELQTVCFRIAQEALTNAVRHGKPSKVQVKLSAHNGQITLSIHDNGIGFQISDRPLKSSSFGLTSMKERANLVGGQVRIESSPGQGTIIHADCPLSHG
jgi:signal transduction histidine kinase